MAPLQADLGQAVPNAWCQARTWALGEKQYCHIFRHELSLVSGFRGESAFTLASFNTSAQVSSSFHCLRVRVY